MKELIANTAKSIGWNSVVDYQHTVDNKAQWRVDVLISNGNVKVAIIIQPTPQTKSDFKSRTERIASTGVRVAWLYHLKKPLRGDHDRHIAKPSSDEVPVFGYQQDKESGKVTVVQFSKDITLEKFVIGLLSKKVRWFYNNNTFVDSMLIRYTEHCPSCNEATVGIYGLRLNAVTTLKIESQYKLTKNGTNKQRERAAFFHFFTKDNEEQNFKIAEFISQNLTRKQLADLNLGELIQVDNEYFCTCLKCGNVLPRLETEFIKGVYDSAKSKQQKDWFDSNSCCLTYGEEFHFRTLLFKLDLGCEIWIKRWFYIDT